MKARSLLDDALDTGLSFLIFGREAALIGVASLLRARLKGVETIDVRQSGASFETPHGEKTILVLLPPNVPESLRARLDSLVSAKHGRGSSRVIAISMSSRPSQSLVEIFDLAVSAG
jgi:hypothetical protein